MKVNPLLQNLLQNQHANFNETWYKLFLGKGNSKLFKNHKNAKIGRGHLKIFSRTIGPEQLKFT
jgi:hypothetical protein